MSKNYFYTQEDIDYLKKNHNSPIEELSFKLGRSPNAIKLKLVKLGLRKRKTKMNYFTQEEVDFLITNKDKYTYEEMGEKIGRPAHSIAYKFYCLGLGKTVKKNRRKKAAIHKHKNTMKELNNMANEASERGVSYGKFVITNSL